VEKPSNFDGLTHLFGIRCIVHRLNQIVLSSIKNVKYLDEVENVLVVMCSALNTLVRD
jgi:hypothetical protein